MKSKELTENSQEEIEPTSVVLIVAAAFFLTGLIIYLSKKNNKSLTTDPPIIIKTGYEEELKNDLTKFIVEINKEYAYGFDEVHSGNHYYYKSREFVRIQKIVVSKDGVKQFGFADDLGLTADIRIQEGGPGKWDDVSDTVIIKTKERFFSLRINRRLDKKPSNPNDEECWESNNTDPLRISKILVYDHNRNLLRMISANEGEQLEIEFYK